MLLILTLNVFEKQCVDKKKIKLKISVDKIILRTTLFFAKISVEKSKTKTKNKI